jgi:hypothetical protein
MTPAVKVRQLDRTIPVLFRSADDPRSYCLVHSLRRPGTPTTGYTSALPGWGKMAEALHLAYPNIRGLALLVDGTEEAADPDCPGVAMPPAAPGRSPPTSCRRPWAASRTTPACAWRRTGPGCRCAMCGSAGRKTLPA